MTARLVVVSNRVDDPRRIAAGGLAFALSDVLRHAGGLWFGWCGEPAAGSESGALRRLRAGEVDLALLELGRDDLDTYYHGYANQVLWPACHYRLDLVRFETRFLEGYRRVNRLFARRLAPLLRPDDLVWVHDYHLIPLADELRALGCRQRIGFFLHIPLPPPAILGAVPGCQSLLRTLFAYDLIGLQTHGDARQFARLVHDEALGAARGEDCYVADGRTVRVRPIPVGIDVDAVQQMAGSAEAAEIQAQLAAQCATSRLIVGIDRLDYSKGLPQRLRAFREMLLRYPEHRTSASLIQIAAPSREGLMAYDDIRHELDSLSGEINGEFGETDWTPVRYLHRSWARRRLPGLYRSARVGMVTPLRDGMNLVAKEYVAAQDPQDPGVLVLSQFAGAAETMAAALLVNPYDLEATARALHDALGMPLPERRDRHAALLQAIRRADVKAWQREFVQALAQQPRRERQPALVRVRPVGAPVSAVRMLASRLFS
jgi:trehalose 6-phosphate synthase